MSGPEETPGEGGGEQVGSVGEEAARLLGALTDWARDHGSELGQVADGLGESLTTVGEGLGGLAGHAASAAREVGDHVDTGAPECDWCPVCRTVHLVRTTSPEVRDHLASAAASLMQAAAGFLVAASAGHPRETADAGVERIDLDDDGTWPEGDAE